MELFQHYPDVEWYFLIDDDTFLFLDNVDEYLPTLNFKKPYYLGSENIFVGCDGVTEFGNGPAFAHGGSYHAVQFKKWQVYPWNVFKNIVIAGLETLDWHFVYEMWKSLSRIRGIII
jgi:hypothetical protein